MAGGLVVVLAGCSLSEYDKVYENATKNYRMAALFQDRYDSVADDRLKLSKPRVFTEEDAAGTAAWSKPPFLREIPGFRTAFRGQVAAGDAKLPVTLAVGVLTDDQFDPDKMRKDISAAVREDAALAKAQWEEVGGVTNRSDQSLLPWSRLRLTGKQPFELVVAGSVEQKNVEGTTDIWVTGSPEHKVAVVLVWRLPAEIQEQIKFEELSRFAVAGVLTAELANPAPAPAAEPAPAAAPAAAAPAQ